MRKTVLSLGVALAAFSAPAVVAQAQQQEQPGAAMEQEAQPGEPMEQQAAEPAAEAQQPVEGEMVATLPREEIEGLVGMMVRSTAGNEIGTLRGISLGEEGAVMAVIEVGQDLEAMGVEKEAITVEADKLTRAPATEELVLHTPVSELQAAPEFLQNFNEQLTGEAGAVDVEGRGLLQPTPEVGETPAEEGAAPAQQ